MRHATENSYVRHTHQRSAHHNDIRNVSGMEARLCTLTGRGVAGPHRGVDSMPSCLVSP